MSSPGTLEHESTVEDREFVAKWKWVGLIVGLLAIQVLIGGMAIFLANSDPAHAVIPNYHQQALEYDKVLVERQISHQLGWKWTITPGNTVDLSGKRQLTVQLLDAKSQPLTEAAVSLQLWHHARGNQRQTVYLSAIPQQPGYYQGEAILDRAGIWQVDLSVDRKTDHFVDRRENHWNMAKK